MNPLPSAIAPLFTQVHGAAGKEGPLTKQGLSNRARHILHTTIPGRALGSEDFRFMVELLSRHPRADEKIGVGIAAIRVEPDPVWGGGMFVAERRDGSTTDFSYRKCLQPTTRRGEINIACRQAVVEDIVAFKREHFNQHGDAANQVLCPLTGQRLGWPDAHIDHAPPWPFRRIVDAFFASTSTADMPITTNCDGGLSRRFVDSDLAERFRQFHARVAMLRVIAAAENLRIG
jgi:hypothetical protein